MLRSCSISLVPVTLTILSFGLGTTRAIAQTTYPFQAVYDVVVESEQITPNVSKKTRLGESADAPYGLTNLISKSYTRLNPASGVTTAGSDAAQFGLEGLPILTDIFFGSSNDSLVGTSTATAVTDLQNLTATASGTVTITGGSGRFSDAKGTLLVLDNYTLSPDPTAPFFRLGFSKWLLSDIPKSSGTKNYHNAGWYRLNGSRFTFATTSPSLFWSPKIVTCTRNG